MKYVPFVVAGKRGGKRRCYVTAAIADIRTLNIIGITRDNHSIVILTGKHRRPRLLRFDPASAHYLLKMLPEVIDFSVSEHDWHQPAALIDFESVQVNVQGEPSRGSPHLGR